MKILVLTWDYGETPLGKKALRDVDKLVERGHQVCVVHMAVLDYEKTGSNPTVYGVAQSVKEHVNEVTSAISALGDWARGISKAVYEWGGFDAVHAYGWRAGLPAVMAKMAFGGTVMLTLDGVKGVEDPVGGFERYAAKNSDVILVPSREAKRALVEEYGVNRRKVWVMGDAG